MNIDQNLEYHKRCLKGYSPQEGLKQVIKEKQEQLHNTYCEINEELLRRQQETLLNLRSILKRLKEHDPTYALRTEVDNLTQSVNALQEHKTEVDNILKLAYKHYAEVKENNKTLNRRLTELRNAKRRKEERGNPLNNFIDDLSYRGSCYLIAKHGSGN